MLRHKSLLLAAALGIAMATAPAGVAAPAPKVQPRDPIEDEPTGPRAPLRRLTKGEKKRAKRRRHAARTAATIPTEGS